ncbi:hypothetical protein N7451_012581 [Penicillium sp. IBT 35674x]|nr:hypothetical protein N7451_012581 [Penicillium sp. IBT 35674x]
MQCLLDDLNSLENQQKGKQPDGKLALSTAAAIVADQDVLASISSDETIAERDRRYALAFSNGEITPHDATALGETEFTEEKVDVVSVIMSDLMSRVRITDNLATDQSSLPSILTSPTSIFAKECVSCLEKFYTTML